MPGQRCLIDMQGEWGGGGLAVSRGWSGPRAWGWFGANGISVYAQQCRDARGLRCVYSVGVRGRRGRAIGEMSPCSTWQGPGASLAGLRPLWPQIALSLGSWLWRRMGAGMHVSSPRVLLKDTHVTSSLQDQTRRSSVSRPWPWRRAARRAAGSGPGLGTSQRKQDWVCAISLVPLGWLCLDAALEDDADSVDVGGRWGVRWEKSALKLQRG